MGSVRAERDRAGRTDADLGALLDVGTGMAFSAWGGAGPPGAPDDVNALTFGIICSGANAPAQIKSMCTNATAAWRKALKNFLIAIPGIPQSCTSGYTNAMSMSRFPVRRRRLLAVGALSLALHLLAIAWIDTRLRQPPASAGSPVLSVRLTQAARGADQPRAPGDAVRRPQPMTRAAAVPVPARPLAPAAAPSPEPPAARQAAPAVVADVAADVVPGQSGSAIRYRMPGRYRVDPPPSARISYTLQRGPAGGEPGTRGQAWLDWRSDGLRYRLQVDGVLGVLESEGDIDDAGIAPRSATEALSAGSATTRFDRDAGAIVAGHDEASHQLVQGSQDMGSLLAQLAGMGRADPTQMQDVLEFWVGGAHGARIERFEVLGPERLETGAGPIDTVKLARLSESGEPGEGLIEIWLAPERSWLPVQLRLTSPDGATLTQTAAAIEVGPQPGQQEAAAPGA